MSFLTARIAEQAIELATPLIQELFVTGVAKRPTLCVVVAVRDDTTRADGFALLARQSFNPLNWTNPYDKIALGKTRISARTGMPSRVVQTMYPELLMNDDVKYWGNAVSGDIIVSCSGVQPWIDEAISNIVLSLIRGLLEDEVTERRENDPGNFFGFDG